jgi:phosphatidylethanolamine/phosphatidyl-N-methylethanolamine N-methyltransferase
LRGVPLFLRRWLAHPLRMGSVVPSSATLCRHVVRCGWPEGDGAVLDLGAGTGVISRTFLDSGLPADRLVAVEIDPNLADHLRGTLRGVEVLECDARTLPEHLPDRFRGRITAVICGIPLVLLPLAEQRRFVAAMAAVAPERGFVLFSYCITSPLPAKKLGLTAHREVWTPLNLPPASVWRYRPR